jgi:hypothetical protein
VCERQRENGPDQSSGLKSPIDESLQSGDVEFRVAGALEDAETCRFTSRRVYAKIKDPSAREFD